MTLRFSILLTLSILLIIPIHSLGKFSSELAVTGPEPLQYQELVQIAQQAQLSPYLTRKIHTVLTTPFIYQNSEARSMPSVEHPFAPVLRVASWNIERGFHADKIAEAFSLEQDISKDGLDVDTKEEWAWLRKSQVLLLTEVDNGMGRTQYRDITRQLAEKLHMNAAYGVEFLELAPLSKQMQAYAKTHDNHIQIAGENFSVDPTQYKGMHGAAILSRYPILNVQIIRLPACYDWLKSEQAKLSQLEKMKRTVADKVFQEIMLTEVRKGGRQAMAVDLSIPELPEKKATFVVAHLENRCKASCRKEQMLYLLNALKHRRNPVVIGGDFNTSGSDASPTSLKKEVRDRLKNPSFWTRQAISLLLPYAPIANASLTISKYTKNFQNPATPHVPLVLPNPEYQIFQVLKSFQFDDGYTLDLRGEDASAYNHRGGFMANSNQRALKGFVPTFEFERSLFRGFVGTYKLDWFFVKGYGTSASLQTKNATHRFAPQFARTLRKINTASQLSKNTKDKFANRLSDHAPITIDLPLSGSL